MAVKGVENLCLEPLHESHAEDGGDLPVLVVTLVCRADSFPMPVLGGTRGGFKDVWPDVLWYVCVHVELTQLIAGSLKHALRDRNVFREVEALEVGHFECRPESSGRLAA